MEAERDLDITRSRVPGRISTDQNRNATTAPAATLSLAITRHERSPMSSTPEHLSNPHHRQTLLQLFQHPTSHNIEWHAVLSLLEAIGSVEARHDGDYAVRVGGETSFLLRPKGKDIDIDQVVALRRMLTAAGYRAVVDALEAKGKEV
jgi:hypothetical protein